MIAPGAVGCWVRMRVRDRCGEKTANSRPSYKFVQANLTKRAATVCCDAGVNLARKTLAKCFWLLSLQHHKCTWTICRTCAWDLAE